MKINEVEQLVGITKKNIRFYEDQGLISPSRNSSNGYRDYSDEDVRKLMRIKLFRRLSIPIAEIRNLFDGKLTLDECVERHLIFLNHEKHNIETTEEMCRKLSEVEHSADGLDAELYLEQMNEIEKGGVRFMNITKTDVIKKKRGARIAALVMIVLLLLWVVGIIIADFYDPIPLPIVLLLTVPAAMAIIGIVIALRERIRELNGGEEDEAADY